MKKQLLNVIALVITCFGVNAQVANYSFTKSVGLYPTLPTPTAIVTATAAGANSSTDDVNYNVALPFNFIYNGNTINSGTNITINTNGWIAFGTAPSGGTYNVLSTTGGTGAIAAFSRDLNAYFGFTGMPATSNGSISYDVLGAAPNRTLAIQWENFRPYSSSQTTSNGILNFQIHLVETSNNIHITYGNMNVVSATTIPQVGIRGATTTFATDVNNLMLGNMPSGTTCNWQDVVTGNVNTSTVIFDGVNPSATPVNGLTFSWAPPSNPSLAPVRVFSAVTGITSSNATISWTAPSGATGYLVEYRIPGTCAWTSAGSVLTTSITLTGLAPLTTYQVRVASIDGVNQAIWSHIPNTAGTGNGYTTTGTFMTSAIPTDLQTVQLTAPSVNASGCYGSSIPVIVQIKNAGTAVLDFSLNNATVITNITGTNPQSYTTTINTGTLAANATQNVTVTTTYNMSAIGVYSINANSTLSSPDLNTANDAMAVVTRTATSGTPTPYMQDFAAGTTPAGWINSSSWSFATNHGVTNNGIYKNLYSSATTASLSTLKLGTLTGVESIAFDFRVLNYTGYPTGGVPTGNWGNLQVQVSSDCGTTYSTIATIDNTTHTYTTNVWSNKNYSLSAYAGQNVTIRFVGSWVAGDYYIDLDNINIASCFAPTGVASTSVTTTTSDITWTAPIVGSPASYFYEVRTSGAAASGTLGLAATGTVTAPSTSVTVTGLTAFTNYSVYVMSYCGGVDVSPWTAGTFTTLANCPAPTALNVLNITATAATATWTAGGSESAWDVYYGTTPLATPNASTVPTATTSTNSYSLTSLTPSTGYGIYVRSNCGGGNLSIWTAISSFTTPCLAPNIVTTSGSTRCGVGTTTLSATADMGGTLNWYATASAPTSIGSGSLFTTPSISATTNYYVSATGALSPGSGARTAPTATSNTSPSDYGLVFDAIKTFTLTSVDVYPTGVAGSLVVNLTNNTGTILQTATIAIPTGTVGTPYNVPLNFSIVPGTGYRLMAFSGPNLIRESSLGGFPNALGNVGSITSGYISGTSTSYYFFYNWQFISGCESGRTMVTATVTNPPALTTNVPSAICGGSGIATLSVTSNVSDYDSYVWAPTSGLYTDAAATVSYTGGNANTVYINSNNSGVLNYNLTANNSITGCASSASSSVSVLDAPTSITVSANPNSICAGTTVSLSASANTIPPVTLLNENFNGAINNWTATNNSTGGTPANAAWTLRNSPYSSGVGTNISSNDASQFYLTDSDSQGSGGTTTTLLQSPAINTTGMQSLNLEFYHFYNYYDDDVAAKVEVSTDGNTWNTLVDYTPGAVDIGTATSFSLQTLSLNSYTNNATVYVRFNYDVVWGYGWAIDNVKITGVSSGGYDYSWTSVPTGFTANTANATDIPTTTTNYSVVITNSATSCSNSSVVTVTVTAIPTITVGASSASVCAGSSATLTAGGATNYTWTSGGSTDTEVVTPTVATVYTVTGETSGCSNTNTVSVGVNPIPSVSASASNTLICYNLGESSVLTVSTSATSYTWSNGANTMSTTVTPTVGTTYTVEVSDGNCNATATVFVDAQTCTGIQSITATSGINVYPNPSNGILNVAIASELSGNTSIEIYDAIGKLVVTENLSSELTTINTSKLTEGVYMYKVINNNKTVKIGKVVKQ
jgi:hypothetical protein